MTYGKLSDRCLKVFVVLLIAGVLGGFCLPHFVAAPVLSADFKPQGGELALAKLIEAGYFDTLVN